MVNKPDPTKDPEFQKVVRHFVTTPPKPHSAMKIGKRKAEAIPDAEPPKKRGRLAKKIERP
jgi:hypothetical protein